METATGDSASESLEVQALIHDQICHNVVEKMIDPDHGPLVEELANEGEFVPGEFLKHNIIT